MKTFKKYHEENPQIYEGFKRIAYQLIRRGYRRLSSKFIVEIVRYETMISGNDKFKINNSYTADYARLFEKDHHNLMVIFLKDLLDYQKFS